MSLALPIRNFFHAGYVVLNLEKAMAGMRQTFGVADWKVLPLPEGTPASAIGFAYVQDRMIELVELDLRQELMAIHRGFVPESDGEARLNHLAYMLDSEDELLSLVAHNEAAGLATAWLEPFGDIFSWYYYADTKAQLGHFTEFVCLGPAGRDFLAAVPRN
jgi:hypothetical protein